MKRNDEEIGDKVSAKGPLLWKMWGRQPKWRWDNGWQKWESGKKESSQFIEENIKLLKRLVDRQTKELAKLNEMMDT